MSYRRLWVLIQGLPTQSKTRAALTDHEWWSDETTLLARIANLLAIGNWMFEQSNTTGKVPQPDLIGFPGQPAEATQRVSPSRRRHLEMIRANGGATPTKSGDT